MADIDVQRREGAPIWLWLVGAALLALLIWAIFAMTGRDDDQIGMVQDTTMMAAETAPITTPEPVGAVPGAVTEYMRECNLEEGTRPDDMGLEHEFTINCFERLANSIEAVAQQRGGAANVTEHVETIRRNARQLQESGQAATNHASLTRDAAAAGASALESMQQSLATADTQVQSSVAEARSTAEQIQPGAMQLEQLGDVRSYFARAGDALNGLASAR